jgi:hypothetical protein
MLGIERAGDGVECPRPVGIELIIHQALGQLGIAQPCEAVVRAFEALALAQQLSGKPLPSVDADLNVEREPGLDAGVHEAEPWIEPVVIEMKALARMEPQSAFVTIGRTLVFERHARFDGLEHTDQPLLDRIFSQHFPRQLLFVHACRLEKRDRSVLSLRLCQGCLLDLFRRSKSELLEVQKLDLRILKQEPHTVMPHQRLQDAVKDHSVESREHTSDERAIA